MNYNYVMITYKSVENKTLYGGIDNTKNSHLLLLEFKESYRDDFLYRAFTTKKLNYIFPKKIRNIFFPLVMKHATKKTFKYFDRILKNELDKYVMPYKTCIVVAARVYEYYKESILDYLKANYQNVKMVTYLADVLDSFIVDKNDLDNNFDKVFSFDKSECKKYNFNYCLEPNTFLHAYNVEQKPEYDVTFIGAAKDRYSDIIHTYEKLREKNLKLDFYIFGVKEEDQKYKDEIHYNEYLSFEDFIKHTLNARCTFEALQKNGSSPTTRFSLCMLYKRKILTNCTELLDSEWEETIKTGNVQVYSDINSIDFDWIKQPCEYDNQKYIDMFSTDRMLETMDSYL